MVLADLIERSQVPCDIELGPVSVTRVPQIRKLQSIKERMKKLTRTVVVVEKLKLLIAILFSCFILLTALISRKTTNFYFS